MYVELTAEMVRERLGVLPAGSFEQHAHLPMATDVVLAEAVAREAVERTSDRGVILLPPVYYSVSLEHGSFPYVGSDYVPFIEYMTGIALSALRFLRGLIIVNGHGGIESALDVVKRRVNFSGAKKVRVFSLPQFYSRFSPCDMHAGAIETSLMAYLGLYRGEPSVRARCSREAFDTLRSDEVSESGAVAQEVRADLELGKKVFEEAVDSLVRLILEVD
ncbi:MAG: creatininase family protein [Thermoprotei archaeon]